MPSLPILIVFFSIQGSRIVNLQRANKDPDPILLSYIPALDLVKQMFADVKNKKGFVLKPQVGWMH